jgi:hypothetical protein
LGISRRKGHGGRLLWTAGGLSRCG